jgi:nucleoside-diphosphate-sugar epimerase
MAVLVTGGTGLVSSRLLRRFVDAGVNCHAHIRPGKDVPAGATLVEGVGQGSEPQRAHHTKQRSCRLQIRLQEMPL